MTSAPSPRCQEQEDGENNGNGEGMTEKLDSHSMTGADATTRTPYPSCDRGNVTTIHNPADQTLCRDNHFIEAQWSCKEGNFPSSMDQTPHHLFSLQYPVLCDGGNLTDPNISTPTSHIQDPITHIKEEPTSHDGGNPTDPNISTPTSHIQDPITHIKEEPTSHDGGNITDPNISTPTSHIQDPITHIKEEPTSHDGGNITDPNISTPTSHIQDPITHIKEEPTSHDGGNLTDANISTPKDHTQYTFSPPKEEPVSSDGGRLMGIHVYTPTDFTQHLTTPIKEEPLSYHEENLIVLGSHSLKHQRQRHPTTHIKEEPALYQQEITDTYGGMSTDLTRHPFPCVKKELVSCNGDSLTVLDNHAAEDTTQQYPSTHIGKETVSHDGGNLPAPDCTAPRDHTQQYTSMQEPGLDPTSSLLNQESSSPLEPLDKNVSKKRKKEVEQNYSNLTLRGKKYFCTIQRTTNSLEIVYNCPECPACFTSNVDLAKHQLNHTRRLPFICSVCGRCFGRKTDLVIHQRTHGAGDTDLHGCTPTDLSQMDNATTIDRAEQYRPTHGKSKVDSCDGGNIPSPDCTPPSDHTHQYQSTPQPVLHKHQSSSSGEPVDKNVSKKRKQQLEQNYNEITISSKKYFCTIQQTTNSLEILYNCPECPECFTSNVDLAKHQIIHAGGMSIICSVCGRSFGRKSDLIIHQTTHGRRDDYACQHCDLSFATQLSLSIHEKTHKQRKLLLCPECGKTFPTKQRLARHMEKPHR
ncbi:oocyte zinc finger protein XlCOF7.1-like isoform X2 [Dendropsophus ebraccatus]